MGYVLPAVAMALPSPRLVSNNFLQLALVAWNMFPIFIYLVMQTLHRPRRLGDTQSYNNPLPEPLDPAYHKAVPPSLAFRPPVLCKRTSGKNNRRRSP
ncbi:hypothetical protein EYZ11_010638 [Aspergillus tanneri]|nr:hypothetical protein EYZ11_010638 [Aspergillus tanneri]